jgi:hypothetical protein
MIDVKTAVQQAIDYVREFADLLPPRDLRLEETELTDDGDWLITLSFVENPVIQNRSYKAFRINGETGAVISMKVRSLVTLR